MTYYGLDEWFSMINLMIALKFCTGAVLLEEYICSEYGIYGQIRGKYNQIGANKAKYR